MLPEVFIRCVYISVSIKMYVIFCMIFNLCNLCNVVIIVLCVEYEINTPPNVLCLENFLVNFLGIVLWVMYISSTSEKNSKYLKNLTKKT